MEPKIVDHLFRHQYGKMVAILTRFFGLAHLETIEDAVQDTFIKATLQWRNKVPDNPEAWLTKAAKNRAIDLLRKIKAEQTRYDRVSSGSTAIHMNDLFLDHEVADSQLRMIFVACHPFLKSNEQIAFALKTISGFSLKEIAAALLIKEETIKKRLSRSKKTIIEKNIQFEFPGPHEVKDRVTRVMEVVYLTFNEGFHSTNKSQLVREELCGEAMRLCKLLLQKEKLRSGSLYALFALLCFHASRLSAKINSENEIIDLENQDRSKWHMPLITLGHDAMTKAMEYKDRSTYHYEAAIVAEHLSAASFSDTKWENILTWYEQMQQIHDSPAIQLNVALVHMQLGQFEKAWHMLTEISPESLAQRTYLLHACFAKYFELTGVSHKALEYLDQAIELVSNDLERQHFIRKREEIGANI